MPITSTPMPITSVVPKPSRCAVCDDAFEPLLLYAGPLRLRHARGDGGVARRRQPEAKPAVQGPRGGRPHAARHHRRQSAQVP
eukprot:855303-Pyramimonas_sp.AAC.1